MQWPLLAYIHSIDERAVRIRFRYTSYLDTVKNPPTHRQRRRGESLEQTLPALLVLAHTLTACSPGAHTWVEPRATSPSATMALDQGSCLWQHNPTQ